MDSQCILQLCDPDALSAGDAIRLARRVSRVEPSLAPSLGAFVGHLSHARGVDPRAMRRALELLYAVSDRRSFAKTCERVVRSERPGFEFAAPVAGGGDSAVHGGNNFRK
jgi:hypothetical protein